MAPEAIVAYDDSPQDRDGLMLARLLQELGTRVTLAYVRHAWCARPDHELLDDLDAAGRLERGAAWLQDPGVQRQIVINRSTAAGLAQLVEATEAQLIVCGPDYRTPLGRVSIAPTARALLDNGTCAVVLAPAGLAQAPQPPELSMIGVLPGTADEASIETAFSLASRCGATVTDRADGVDLLVVGSRREARPGRVLITGAAEAAIEAATAPVLVVARDVALSFETLVTA